MTTAARGASRSMKETQDIARADENIEALLQREKALDDEILKETSRITENSPSGAIERVSLTPKRGQVSVQLMGLGWLPEGY